MHFDVAERAFRVAGVRHRARSVRFAWQAWCDLARRRASFCVAGAGDCGGSLKQVEFVALYEKSAACVRVDV